MSPLKIFEYMSLGKPIICSSFSAIKEVLKDGHNSILVPPSDRKSWLRALRKITSNKSLKLSIGLNAKKDLENKYTWDIRVKKIIKECVLQLHE